MVTRECFHLYRPFSGEAGHFAASAYVDSLEIDPFFVNSKKLFFLSEKKVNLSIPSVHKLNLHAFHPSVQ
jgi:hypothetical protein